MRTNQLKNVIVVFFALVLLLNGCATPPGPVCTKDETLYCKTGGIFGGKWFDYYERALSCMEGQCYNAALSDLNQAIKRRHEDERMVKTYGMHFADYFPHREKGLIHFIEQDYENAVKELELSLKHEPSAKALYYLDKVRKDIMEQEKQPVSIPFLVAESFSGIPDESGEIWTKENPVTISGRAEDRQYISEIILKDEFGGKHETKPVFMESSCQNVIFKEDLDLDQGRHVIGITARNLLGGKAEQRFVINFDRTGPVIILEKFIPGTVIKGAVHDESGEITLFVNGNPVSVKKKNNISLFELPADPYAETFTLLAVDRPGNQTKAIINKSISANTPNPLLAAQTNQFAADTDYPLLTSDTSHFSLLFSHFPIVFRELFNIEGQVRSASDIVELTINNEPVLKHPGRIIFFSHPLKLKQGENRCVLKARDETGREAEKEIIITRKIPEIYQLEHRFRLAVYPFECLVEFPENIENTKVLQYSFIKNITDRKRFMLIMRDELQNISNEYSYSPPENTRKTPHALVFVNISKTIHGIEITAQVVDKNTSESLEFMDVYADSKDRFTPELLGKKLSEKLHRKFPLVDGAVTQITNDGLTVVPEKWIPGKGEIRMKWPVLAYRKENSQANISESDTDIIGETFVNRLMLKKYGTALVPGINPGDGVITR
ncbi:MAG: hypothetical protein GY749_12275 [Desulfobacteraceae bacterium]|nr:hypothetical protein [Desulfobacteraceae bacterium]